MFDSRKANVAYYNHLLAQFGLTPLKEEDIPYVHMHTAERSVQRIFKNTPYVEAAQAFRMKMDYRPFIQEMVMEPGLVETLQVLKERYRLAVATNRTDTIWDVLSTFGIRDFFSLVVSSLDVRFPKPHPEPLLRILDVFGLAPTLAVYVGDSEVDRETAFGAGVPFIAYRNKRLGADRHAERLMEVPGLLDGLLPIRSS